MNLGRAIGATVAFAICAFIVSALNAGESETIYHQIYRQLASLTGLVFVFGAFVVFALYRK